MGVPQCTVAVAMLIDPMMPRGPSGLNKPKAVSTPPLSSGSVAAAAHRCPGFRPSASIMPAVPAVQAPQRTEYLSRPMAGKQPAEREAQDKERRFDR
jgi:hypothetical protein